MSPINPTVFPYLTTVLLGIGTFFTAWFFVFEGIIVIVDERLKHSFNKKIIFLKFRDPNEPERSR